MPDDAAAPLPAGWHEVPTVDVRVLVGPGGVVVVARTPSPDLVAEVERLSGRSDLHVVAGGHDLADVLADLPPTLDAAHVEAIRLRLVAGLPRRPWSFPEPRTAAATKEPDGPPSRLTGYVALAVGILLLLILIAAGPQLANQVGSLTG